MLYCKHEAEGMGVLDVGPINSIRSQHLPQVAHFTSKGTPPRPQQYQLGPYIQMLNLQRACLTQVTTVGG